MTDAQVWHFYHITRKKKYGPFSAAQLCTIFSKNNIQSDQILIFKNGWEKWQTPLKEEFFNQYFNSINKNIKVEPVQDTVVATNIVEFKKPEAKLTTSSPEIKANLNVIIVCGKKSFKTKTLFIGNESLILRHFLPDDYQNKNLHIFLKSPDKKTCIKLDANVIRNEKEIISFTIENEFSSNTFEKWLKYFTEKNNQLADNLKKSA